MHTTDVKLTGLLAAWISFIAISENWLNFGLFPCLENLAFFFFKVFFSPSDKKIFELNGKAKQLLNFFNNLGHILSGPSDLITVSLASCLECSILSPEHFSFHSVHTEQKGDYFLHLEQ